MCHVGHLIDFVTVDSSVCPIVATMKMLGNQWNMIAIRYLHDEPMRYNQLRRAMGNVSSKTLSRSLKHLMDEEIVDVTSIVWWVAEESGFQVSTRQ